MSDDQNTNRPRGRPRVAEKYEPVSTRVPPAYYDRLNKLANARGVSMSQLVRHLIVLTLTPDK